jgi:pyruvate formate lyase activating enzyme
MNTGIIFDIKRYAINDGPGIRTAVFFKGCPLECWWCHNPEGQFNQPQLMIRLNRCKSSQSCLEVCLQGAITWDNGPAMDWGKCDQCGKCAQVCYAGGREMVGSQVTVAEVMSEIERDVPFYDQSGGGVTFTGGEPLAQTEFLKELLLACRQQHIRTAVDTSGYTSWENISALVPLVDLFLYDVKLMDETRHMKFTAVSNKLILNNLRKLSETGAHIIVRLPLIPGINDDAENIELCGATLAKLPTLDAAELIPYHDIGSAKYEALGLKYKLENMKPLTDEQVNQVEETLSNLGINVIKHQGRVL